VAQPPVEQGHQGGADGPAAALEEGNSTAVLPGQNKKTEKCGSAIKVGRKLLEKLTPGRSPCR